MKKLILILAFAAIASAQVVNNRVARVTFETLSSATTSTTFKVDQLTPSKHTVQVIVTGGPATCTISLDGSLDGGTTFASLSGSQTCTSNIVFHVVERPVDAVRINLSALSGGTSPTVVVRYVGTF